jgi:phosphoribosylformylglycinamidine synthase
MIGRVFVMPKREVLDPQGQAIRQSLQALGFSDVAEVRLGKYLELRLLGHDAEGARKELDDMCRRLLANEVIEEYRVEVLEAAADGEGAGD